MGARRRQELEERGASQEEMERMLEVLQKQVDKDLPWLADVLEQHFTDLARAPTSSDLASDDARMHTGSGYLQSPTRDPSGGLLR